MSVPGTAVSRAPLTLGDLLALEMPEPDLFSATAVFDDPLPLYGGQVAAQALRAAGLTVAADRWPHSLHGYFLRAGDASRPTTFRVDRDRDGRSYSGRRVVAVQDGKIIFSMSASFHVVEPGLDRTVDPAPRAAQPDASAAYTLPRLLSMEARLPVQPFEGVEWPTMFWARCTDALPDDPLTHACTLTYLSDISTGLSPLHDETRASSATLDHAMWFHRPVRLDNWVLIDLVPRTVAAGRGWYTGTVHTPDGVLVASLTQETLFREIRRTSRTFDEEYR